jgi:hypothetical protein
MWTPHTHGHRRERQTIEQTRIIASFRLQPTMAGTMRDSVRGQQEAFRRVPAHDTMLQGGDHSLVVVPLPQGPAPEARLANSKMAVGGRQVRFDGENTRFATVP